MTNRRSFLKTAGFAVAAAALPGQAGRAIAQDRKKPNVLFIISDDLCAALSGYGHPQCKTPNIDRIAREGVQFERAYCQYPVCGPSRASILCGQYPAALGTMTNILSVFRKRHPDVVTLPQFLKKEGYYTARVSKLFHMGIPGEIVAGTARSDDRRAWDKAINIKTPEHHSPGEKEDLTPKVRSAGMSFIKVEAEGDDLVQADGQAAQKAIELLNELKDKPFFLGVGMVRPHVPLVAPKEYFKDYSPEQMKLAMVPEDDLSDVPKAAQTQTNKVKYGMDEEQKKKALSGYYASIAFMDAQVGKILDELKRLKLDENTIVLFTSDHGYNLGEHTCWQKLSLWENTVRCPLIISAPWLTKSRGRKCMKVVEMLDIYPTLVDMCGFNPPEGLPGTSMKQLMDDPSGKEWKDKCSYTITIEGESLRTDKWRYNEWRGRKGKNKTDTATNCPKELYDQEKDPGEFTNLARNPEYAEVIEEMGKMMEKARQRSRILGGN